MQDAAQRRTWGCCAVGWWLAVVNLAIHHLHGAGLIGPGAACAVVGGPPRALALYQECAAEELSWQVVGRVAGVLLHCTEESGRAAIWWQRHRLRQMMVLLLACSVPLAPGRLSCVGEHALAHIAGAWPAATNGFGCQQWCLVAAAAAAGLRPPRVPCHTPLPTFSMYVSQLAPHPPGLLQ
jgi:hypothetical protein